MNENNTHNVETDFDNASWEAQEDVISQHGQIYEDLLIEYISLDYSLFEDGNLNIQVSLIVKNISKSAVVTIPWVVHLRESRVFSGFKFSPNSRIRTVQSDMKAEAIVLLFNINPLQINETIHLQFEYLCDEPVKVHERLFHKRYVCPVIYTSLSPIKNLEIRMHLPKGFQYRYIEPPDDLPSNHDITVKDEKFFREFKLAGTKSLIGRWSNDYSKHSPDNFRLEVFLEVKYLKESALPVIFFLGSTIFSLVIVLSRELEKDYGIGFGLLLPFIWWLGSILLLIRILNTNLFKS